MSDKKSTGVIRPDAIPVQIYNDGLFVYLYDASHLSLLQGLVAKQKNKSDDIPFFVQHFENKLLAREVKARKLFVYYELRQDDEIDIEVCVGQPLTKAELSIARWHKPQFTRLDLPSGRLCIESPNSFRLDDDEKTDSGAIVEVPAGKYVVTLYRIDWEEMRRAEIKNYGGPQEVIVLTPLDKSRRKPRTELFLPFVIKSDDSWMGQYSIEGNSFTGLFQFISYWENGAVNLDEKAIKALGWEAGQRFQIKTDVCVIEAIYLGDVRVTDFLNHYGREAFDTRVASYPEFALAEWNTVAGQTILCLYRRKAGKVAPEKYLNSWIRCTGKVLEDRWNCSLFDAAPPALCEDGQVSGAVTALSSEEAVLNIRLADLQRAGFAYDEIVTLETPCTTHSLWLDLHAPEWKVFCVLTADLSESSEAVLRRLPDTYGCVTLQDSPQYERYTGNLPVVELPGGLAWPVWGTISDMAKDGLLRIKPMYLNTSSSPAEWASGLQIGTSVTLRK